MKAAHTKPILFFVAELAREIFSHCKCYLERYMGMNHFLYIYIYLYIEVVWYIMIYIHICLRNHSSLERSRLDSPWHSHMRQRLQEQGHDAVGCSWLLVGGWPTIVASGWFSETWSWLWDEMSYCICWAIIHQLEQGSHQLQNPSQVVASLDFESFQVFLSFVRNRLWEDTYNWNLCRYETFYYDRFNIMELELRHSWCHIIYDLKNSDENPRNRKTLAEESMLGKLTKLASAVHGGTTCKRFFERFRLFLAMHWQNIAKSDLSKGWKFENLYRRKQFWTF